MPLLLGAVISLWIGLAIVDLPQVHTVLERWTGEWEERQEAMSEQYDASHYRWSRHVPTVLFIDFDDDSIASATTRSGNVSTLKFAIASLLDMLHSDTNARPALVFLDISPGLKTAGDAKLQAALQRWAEDTRSAPLAIFGGRACPHGDPYETHAPLSDAPQASLILPSEDGTYVASGFPRTLGKIVWSCPLYNQMREQLFWSCVTSNDSGAVAALLSPSWFATAVRDARDAKIGILDVSKDGLVQATKACLGGEKRLTVGPEHVRVARSNPLKLTFDPKNPDVSNLDGVHVVVTQTAKAILSARTAGRSLADEFEDKIVVIGSTGRLNGQYDRIRNTRFGDVPGSMMVAEELRSGWAMGYPEGSNWLFSQVVATSLVVSAFFILKLAHALKLAFGKGGTLTAKSFTVFANLHVLAIVIIPLLTWLTFLLGKAFFDLDLYKVAFAFVLTEALFIGMSIIQELQGENLPENHRPVPVGVDHGGPSSSSAEKKPDLQ